MSEQVLVTTEGREVRLRPVSLAMLQELQIAARKSALAAGEPIEPPTYAVTTVSGDIERHPHDASTLESDEDRAAWELHQAALQKMEADANQRAVRYLLTEGVLCEEPPEEWVQRMTWLGVEVAEHPLERRMQYLEREVLRTAADIMRVVQTVMHLSAEGSKAIQERLSVLDDLFRRALEGETAP